MIKISKKTKQFQESFLTSKEVAKRQLQTPAKTKNKPPKRRAIVVPTEPELYCPLVVETAADLVLMPEEDVADEEEVARVGLAEMVGE